MAALDGERIAGARALEARRGPVGRELEARFCRGSGTSFPTLGYQHPVSQARVHAGARAKGSESSLSPYQRAIILGFNGVNSVPTFNMPPTL